MPEFEDKNIDCADCKESFVWDAGEQKFFAEKDFTPPKRCPACRKKKKEQRDRQGGGDRR